jgi:hypothetical protein
MALSIRGGQQVLKGIVVATSLAAVLAVGCGSSERLSKQEYKARLHAINLRVGRAEGAAEAALASGATKRLRRAMLKWADTEEQSGNELAHVRPPEEAEGVNRSLSAAEKQFAAALRYAADALNGAPPTATPKRLERRMQPRMESSPAPAALDRAIARLKALGYAHG